MANAPAVFFGLVAQNYRKAMAMESCQTKAKNGFINLKIGGHLAYTLFWNTLLLALVEGGVDIPVFCVANKISDAVRQAVPTPCECSPLRVW